MGKDFVNYISNKRFIIQNTKRTHATHYKEKQNWIKKIGRNTEKIFSQKMHTETNRYLKRYST